MFKFDDRLLRSVAVALTLTMPIGATLTISPAPAQAQAGPEGEVDIETFHRELSPHGKWLQHSRWGEVWRPDVEDGWRPYTRGHWAWTDEHGWYWVAEEEWGWAPFHYGRWVFDDSEEEWLWIPGTEWAPAWVQWRESEDHIGWAPLPPDSDIDGSSLRLNQTYYDSPRFSRYWVFAPTALMFAPGLYRHIVPTARFSTVWRTTRHVNLHHRFDRGRIYLPGVDHRRIERWSGRSVPVISLRPVGSARDYGWRRMTDRTTVPVYRPRVVTRSDFVRPSRPFFGGADRNRDGVPDWRQDRNRDGRPDWTAGDRNRDGVPDWRQRDRAGDGRPVVVVPGQGRDRNRDGVPDWRQDGRPDGRQDRNRDGVPDWRQGGNRQSEPAAAPVRAPVPAVTAPAPGGESAEEKRRRISEQLRRMDPSTRDAQLAQDAARRAQEDAARRAADTARQQQQQQQDAARRAAEAARQQQQQQQQQEAARRAAEAARRSQSSGAAATTTQAGAQPKSDGQRRGDGAGSGEGRKRDGEGRGEGRRKREEQQKQQPQRL